MTNIPITPEALEAAKTAGSMESSLQAFLETAKFLRNEGRIQ